MKINIRKSALKDLKNIDTQNKDRIHTKIKELINFPSISNVKKLTRFEPAYRLRIGDYRVLFDVTEDTIEIGRILHRKDSY
ncbi:MAG: type II toxin-antitoxin system RelE/ParE family toxin [Deltaproteobacteria bacterium]|jgi:mRNA interferase RelE/StbE|nr:type II toxin-antitoxin system RelE/ParE family toxin [Deltaproteobacteria bacterium]MBT4068859.1 type II toxin-antitoxin system RelE/ParE family toxin [Candidatus Neomarinimicrobiota bacterium]MBT6636753.1 type II toxin-antitoxin system RelE/ParE family toxin [Candidatus Neomarinimicrobiota bacterium]